MWLFQTIQLYSLDFLEFNLNILIKVNVILAILLTATNMMIALYCARQNNITFSWMLPTNGIILIL